MNDAHWFTAFFLVFIPTAVIVVAIYDRVEAWWMRDK